MTPGDPIEPLDTWTKARRAREEGDVARSRSLVLSHLARHGDAADAHVFLGSLAHLEGDLEEAARCHRRALSLAPRHGPAHASLAVVLAQRGELATARAHLEASLECEGLDDVAWLRAERQRASLAIGGAPLPHERVATPMLAPSTRAPRRTTARGEIVACSIASLRDHVPVHERSSCSLARASLARAGSRRARSCGSGSCATMP
jgi:tetratricopeptide (TPR) repeat protein